MKPISQFLAERAPGYDGKLPAPKAPACANCGDLGYVWYDYQPGHPMFGKAFPCPNCNRRAFSLPDEYGLLPADRALAWSGILDLEPSISQAVQIMQETLARGCGWVYLWGGYGTAKTVLLKTAVAEYLRSQAEQAVYLRMSDMMDEIRAAFDFDHPQVESQKRVRWFSSLPLLAIDEFEKVNQTDFVDERRFQIMDARYEAATRQDYGVTLIAANVPPKRLPGAIASRVRDGRFAVFHITANDVRPMADEFGF